MRQRHKHVFCLALLILKKKKKKSASPSRGDMSTLENQSVDFYSVQRDYWRQVKESEGFDVENISLPSNSGVITGLMPYDCVRFKSYPHPVMVNLYAKVGLHRYNMLKETNFQLDSLVKFNMLQHCLSSFYITLLAHDPAIHPLEKPFPVKVDEEKNTLFAYYMHHFQSELLADSFFKVELPDWPSNDALNDGKRFYLVKESEWQANDWIPMYLELVICADARLVAKRDVVSKLEILEVAIETGIEDVEPPNERLKATRAYVYIKFKGLANVCSPRMIFEIGEHVERKAVVRRVLDKYGCLTILGKFCGGRSTKNQPSAALQNGKKIQSCKKQPRSD
ncbi:BnaA07g09730D [Brassica napus]|uniref:BnaA07g09730D protein n=1 Tax=Brassica napus TaxID=3708 RepID=A0A078GKL9_BRANA|nr:BnaA07g09730D [Brassica napus]